MAEAIRLNEELLTVKLDLRMTDNGMRVVVDAFRGAAPLGNELRFPLEALENQSGGRSSFDATVAPPARLLEVFDTVHNHTASDEPIWLQIAYGAGLLAAYPWEDVFGPEIGRQILRIPNFFRSGYRGEPNLPIAICAATPIAKGAPDWTMALGRLLTSLDDGPERDVVLFVGEESRHEANNLGDFPNLRIHLPPPPKRAEAPARETQIIQHSQIANPWLAWMAKELGPVGAQAIHMLCPGYSRDARGALALPESPQENSDRYWARFVGADEFARFADQINAQAVGFSALGDNVWKEGIRLVANELGWIRPGPVIADCGGSDGAALDRAYGVLFGYRNLTPEPVPGLVFSVHPSLLERDGEDAASLRSIPRSAALDPAAESVDFESRIGASSLTVPRDVARAIDQLSSARPRSPVESARDRGRARAMEFVVGLAQGGSTK